MFLSAVWTLIRHPFTAEDPLVRKLCNATFPQICSDEETNSSTSCMAWGWTITLSAQIFLGPILCVLYYVCKLHPSQGTVHSCQRGLITTSSVYVTINQFFIFSSSYFFQSFCFQIVGLLQASFQLPDQVLSIYDSFLTTQRGGGGGIIKVAQYPKESHSALMWQ